MEADGTEVDSFVRVRGLWSCSCLCSWEEKEENDEAKAESGMERGLVSWLSDWAASLPLPLASRWWLSSACMCGLWDSAEGGGEEEGEQEVAWGGLATAPSIFMFTSAFSFSFSFLFLGCESPRSSSSDGHEDGRGPR